jgi:gas vesicle protein
MSRITVKGFLVGFLAGGTVGAIVALLTTPKSGRTHKRYKTKVRGIFR